MSVRLPPVGRGEFAQAGCDAVVYGVCMAKRTVSVRIEPELHARIEALARARRWSVSQWVALAAERAADGEEAKSKAPAAKTSRR